MEAKPKHIAIADDGEKVVVSYPFGRLNRLMSFLILATIVAVVLASLTLIVRLIGRP
jgi:hypothetical protein